MSFLQIPDLGAIGLWSVVITSDLELTDEAADDLKLDQIDGSLGTVGAFESGRYGLQHRVRRASEDLGSKFELELRCGPLRAESDPYDRSGGRLLRLFKFLVARPQELAWQVRAHAHRSVDRNEPVVALPLALPPGSLTHFHEVSGVRLVARARGGQSSELAFDVEVDRRGEVYAVNSSFRLAEAFRQDLLDRLCSRAAEVIGYAFSK